MRQNVFQEIDGQDEITQAKHRMAWLTRIASDGTRKMRVNGACQTVMPERIPAHAAGAEVLRRQHAARCHDANEGIECWLGGVL